jgi:hypothetical protein
MATSVRIRVGLREFQLEADTRAHVGAGTVLLPREAVRLLGGVRDTGTLALIRSVAAGVGARSLEWDEELGLRVAALLETGRLRLRTIEAGSLRVLGSEARIEEQAEREPNEIVETHSVMIELIDAEGNPVPGEPFRIELPDGTVRSLTLDDEGKAHVTGIEQPGTCQVCFYKRDAAIWAPA